MQEEYLSLPLLLWKGHAPEGMLLPCPLPAAPAAPPQPPGLRGQQSPPDPHQSPPQGQGEKLMGRLLVVSHDLLAPQKPVVSLGTRPHHMGLKVPWRRDRTFFVEVNQKLSLLEESLPCVSLPRHSSPLGYLASCLLLASGGDRCFVGYAEPPLQQKFCPAFERQILQMSLVLGMV